MLTWFAEAKVEQCRRKISAYLGIEVSIKSLKKIAEDFILLAKDHSNVKIEEKFVKITASNFLRPLLFILR